MGFRKLIKYGDISIKDSLEDVYFISKDRMDNYMSAMEDQVQIIKELKEEKELLVNTIIKLDAKNGNN